MGLKILTWVVMSYGLTNIVVFGSIFGKMRDWLGRKSVFLGDLVSCPMCFSTWGGFALSVLVFSPTEMVFEIPKIYSWFFDGILSSGSVWAINSIIEWFEKNVPNDEGPGVL